MGNRFWGVDLYQNLAIEKISFVSNKRIEYILDGDKYIANNGKVNVRYYKDITFLGFC